MCGVYGSNLTHVERESRCHLACSFGGIEEDLSTVQESLRNVDCPEKRGIKNNDETGAVDLAPCLYDLVTYPRETCYWSAKPFWPKFRKRLYVFPFKKSSLSKQPTGRDHTLSSPPMPPYLVEQDWSPESLAVYIEGSILSTLNLFYIGRTTSSDRLEITKQQTPEVRFQTSCKGNPFAQVAPSLRENNLERTGRYRRNCPRFYRFLRFAAVTSLPEKRSLSSGIPIRTKCSLDEGQEGKPCM